MRGRRTHRFLWVMLLMLGLGQESVATTMKKSSCPDHFIGKVLSIDEPQVPYDSLEWHKLKVKITFEAETVMKGSSRDLSIEILKHSQDGIKVGQRYEVELRGHRLCSLKLLP